MSSFTMGKIGLVKVLATQWGTTFDTKERQAAWPAAVVQPPCLPFTSVVTSHLPHLLMVNRAIFSQAQWIRPHLLFAD